MKNKILLIILLTLSLLSVSCAVQNNPRNPKMANTEVTTVPKILDETPKDAPAIDMKNCVCVQMWMPVCGENGKTYSNSCFANCAKVKFKPGSCTKAL